MRILCILGGGFGESKGNTDVLKVSVKGRRVNHFDGRACILCNCDILIE